MKDLTEQILQDVITTRPQESFKGTFGKVLLVGGNHQFGGAIIMAATAAVNAGAGLVTVACDLVNRTALHARLPEAMVIDFSNQAALLEMLNGVDTIVVGPGLGEEEQSLAVLKTVFANTKPTQTVVIDGSAITLMATHQLAAPAGHLVFTPTKWNGNASPVSQSRTKQKPLTKRPKKNWGNRRFEAPPHRNLHCQRHLPLANRFGGPSGWRDGRHPGRDGWWLLRPV